MRKPGLKPFDYIILAASVLLVILLSVLIYSGSEADAVVRIDAAGTQYIYPLDIDSDIKVAGPIGLTHVIISSGEVFISESPCQNKLCILMGAISKQGHWAACMPNRIFISIEGAEDEQEIDVLSY